ncbi:host attachment protein [Nannocystaceae bacterium ST9]
MGRSTPNRHRRPEHAPCSARRSPCMDHVPCRIGACERMHGEPHDRANCAGTSRLSDRVPNRDTIQLEVPMVPTLFVVADQGQAQLYKVGGTKLNPTLEVVDQLSHPAARERPEPHESGSHHEIIRDSAGEEEERRFVRELVDRLKKGQSSGEFQRLYVAAPANFVGRLRKHYGNSLARTVEREIIGDYTRQDERTLLRRFSSWMD